MAQYLPQILSTVTMSSIDESSTNVPIPQPLAIPFLGNVANIDQELPVRSFELLAKRYGEIYQLVLLGEELSDEIVTFPTDSAISGNKSIHLNSYALVNEVSNEKRFMKNVSAALGEVRNLAGDALFTAKNDEPNWGIAHRILMPAFGTLSIRNMFEGMRDVAEQLVLKWERFGPEHLIDPSDDFTRTALDAISLCTMGYRMNSFYSTGPPEFANAMGDFLKECFARTRRPQIVQTLMSGATAKYETDMGLMRSVADKIIADRKANPVENKDLLNLMLTAKDPKTGQRMSEESIAQNLLTFLVAGHETSSGMMSFMVYFLLKNPDTLRKVRAEIDTVLEGRPMQAEDMDKLPYLEAVMRETLRLAPTAPARSVRALHEETLGNGKYSIPTDANLVVHTWIMQKDPAIWGEDANDFRPERMMDGKFEALPPNAWQPFGFGMRGCIGRAFAWQEVMLVMAMAMQKLDLSFADPSYSLDLKQSLTLKPKNLFIKAKLRIDAPKYTATGMLTKPSASSTQATESSVKSDGPPLYVVYGSNTGTSEALAQRLAGEAAGHGFSSKMATLDSITGQLPKDGPLIIVTASFEGQPADNAAHFVDWLESNSESLDGVKYVVFGCGNSDWVQTYQRVPRLIDELLEKSGSSRLAASGEGDVKLGSFFQNFDDFSGGLWDILTTAYSTSSVTTGPSSYDVQVLDVGTKRAAALRQSNMALGKVIENRVLTLSSETAVKRHIEFELPEDATYRAGDYLAILPRNPISVVRRVLKHFSLSAEQIVTLSSVTPTTIPLNEPVAVFDILSGYVELSQPATSRDIQDLLSLAEDGDIKDSLRTLLKNYNPEIQEKRVSVLDIVERFPLIKVPFGVFLFMLPAMRVRQYSISSSPLWSAEKVSLTISVLEAPSISEQDRIFTGVASTYLAGLSPGDQIQMSVRASGVAFHPPTDISLPIVMFCAGSGVAPMRGFIQERAAQKQSGRNVGPALLFFGCRSPDADYLYSDSDLAQWIKEGVVDVRPAFSRASERSEGCKYVQDRVWHDRKDVKEMYENGAKFFTCGSGRASQGVKEKLVDIIHDTAAGRLTRDEAASRFNDVTNGRYATDIFD